MKATGLAQKFRWPNVLISNAKMNGLKLAQRWGRPCNLFYDKGARARTFLLYELGADGREVTAAVSNTRPTRARDVFFAKRLKQPSLPHFRICSDRPHVSDV